MSSTDSGLDWALRYASSLTMVGSRVTCSPPPTDTDQDVLVLVSEKRLDDLLEEIGDRRFTTDGSEIIDPAEHLRADHTFQSFRKGDLNLIVTTDEVFHKRFLAATAVAKRLNLLDKQDRIALFQAVLYGNGGEA